MTVVLVTHDREEAFSIADRIAVMRAGTVVQEGSPEELYLAPADRWVAEFVGAGNFVPGRIDGELVETLLGRFPVTTRNGATNVDVLIRPELLELEPDPAGGQRSWRGSSAATTSSTACGSATERLWSRNDRPTRSCRWARG